MTFWMQSIATTKFLGVIPTVSSIFPVEIAIERLFWDDPAQCKVPPHVGLPDNVAGRENFHDMEYGVPAAAFWTLCNCRGPEFNAEI
jgi:hypothetical protein